MMLYAAILILGASGTATRTIVVDDSIAGIVLRIAKGGVEDAVLRRDGDRLGIRNIQPVALTIDGEPATGLCGWSHAAVRIAAYAADVYRDGDVRYTYRCRLRGYDVRREARISDGHVVLTTDVYGKIGPKGELYHVRIVVATTEQAGCTRIHGTTTGWTHIGQRCRLVARIASREISRTLDAELLGALQRGGTRLYHAGELHRITDTILEGLIPQ